MNRNNLVEIERLFGFVYPRSFHSGVDEFVTFCGSPGFRRDFPTARLLLSTTEIIAEQKSMDYRQSLGVAGVPLPPEIVERSDKVSRALVPFLRDEGRQFPDIYAFNLESRGPEYAVVVWCYADPVVVHKWDGFAAFFQWLREHVASHDKQDA